MEEQEHLRDLGGTMRLGEYPCDLTEGTNSSKVYGVNRISERHRHRYEFNNAYRERLENAGLKVAGVCTERDLVEIVELENHNWYVGCQFHGEYKSRPVRPHPLFDGFIDASVKYMTQRAKEV